MQTLMDEQYIPNANAKAQAKVYQFPNQDTNNNVDLQTLHGNVAQSFLDQCSKETARTYKTSILEFFQVQSTKDIKLSNIESISFNQIEEWLNRNKNKFRVVKGEKKFTTVATMSKHCSSLASLIEYVNHLLIFTDLSAIKNIFKDKYLKSKIKQMFVTTKSKSIEVFTIEEVSHLFQTIESSDKVNARRDYIMFKVLFNLGLRREELVNIAPNDICEVNGEHSIKITKAKGNKQREIYLSGELHNLLQEMVNSSEYDTRELIFNMTGDNVYKALNSYCELANIEKDRIYTHLARHTFASIADNNGASLRDIQETLGHESHTTTSGYIHRANKFNKSASRMVNL